MNYISFSSGRLMLAGKDKIPRIYVRGTDKGILRAADDLCMDFFRVTGRAALITKDETMADLVIETSDSGEWESFRIFFREKQLVVSGSDKRGTIFGIYDVSRKLGVSPWYWWADVAPTKHENVYVNLDGVYTEGSPDVPYRGIFINDEESMAAWAMERKDFDYIDTYKHMYELILRLKANTLWPAMHSCSPWFHKNPENAKNAEEYGIVIGTAHCEQMLRNNITEYFPFEKRWEEKNPQKPLYKAVLGDSPDPCGYIYTDINPDTGEKVYNKEMIQDYWRESVRLYGTKDNYYTLGMRGLHDFPWQPVGPSDPLSKAHLIEEVMEAQRRILCEELKLPITEIHQLFLPYKEMLEIYNAGMQVPEDVTLMWSNDNYGYLRQLPTALEQKRSGGIGIYYHLSYCGCPKSYLWISTTPFALMKEELLKGYENGIRQIWIANAGDLKGAEKQIEYFLHLAWNAQNAEKEDIADYLAKLGERDFGLPASDAYRYAQLELSLQQLAFSRKPEFFTRDLFALKVFGDEGMRYLKSYEKLFGQAQALKEKVPQEKQAAFFELFLYFVNACYFTAARYIYMDEQKQHIEDGFYQAAGKYIQRSDNAYYRMIQDMHYYYQLFGGKWKHIMDSCYNGFVSRTEAFYPLLQCKVKYSSKEGIGATGEPLYFSGYLHNECFVDLFHHFWLTSHWTLTPSHSWILPEKQEGTLHGDERILVRIDYENAPADNVRASLTLTSDHGDHIEIPVYLENIVKPLSTGTYPESLGYVSIPAVSASRYRNAAPESAYSGLSWGKVPYLGRENDCLKACLDLTDTAIDPVVGPLETKLPESLCQTCVAEYDIDFISEGTFQVDIYRLPTLNELGEVRFAIGVDDQTPDIIQCTNKYVDFSDGTDSWGTAVLQNNELLHASIRIKNPGVHTLKLYCIDPYVMIEKLVVWTKDPVPSYFGPPSYQVLPQ